MCTAVRLKVAKSWAWCSATLSYCDDFFENFGQRNNSLSHFYKSYKKKSHLFSFCTNFEPVQLFKANACRRKGAESSRIQVVASNYDNNYNYKAGIAETAYHAKKKVTPTKNS